MSNVSGLRGKKVEPPHPSSRGNVQGYECGATSSLKPTACRDCPTTFYPPPLFTPMRPKSSGPLYRRSRHSDTPFGRRTWENHDVPRWRHKANRNFENITGSSKRAQLPTLEQKKWLRRRGFDPLSVNSRRGRRQETAMHQAAREGDIRTAEWLLACGAAISVKDMDGNTPSHFAAREAHQPMLEWLERNGGATCTFDSNDLGVLPITMMVGSQERKRIAAEREADREKRKHQIHPVPSPKSSSSRSGEAPHFRRSQSQHVPLSKESWQMQRPDEVLSGIDRRFVAIMLIDPTKQKVAAKEFCETLRQRPRM